MPLPWAELQAGISSRRDVHAGMLPSNGGTALNAETGMPVSDVENIPGWTVQHPRGRRKFVISEERCVLCWVAMDPNDISGHHCPVRAAYGVPGQH